MYILQLLVEHCTWFSYIRFRWWKRITWSLRLGLSVFLCCWHVCKVSSPHTKYNSLTILYIHQCSNFSITAFLLSDCVEHFVVKNSGINTCTVPLKTIFLFIVQFHRISISPQRRDITLTPPPPRVCISRGVNHTPLSSPQPHSPDFPKLWHLHHPSITVFISLQTLDYIWQ